MKVGESAGGWRWLLGDCLGIGQRVVSNRIVPHLFCVVFYRYYYYFPFLFRPIQLSLSQPTSFTFSSDSLPHPSGVGTERAAVWCLAACQVKPQHLPKLYTKQSHLRKVNLNLYVSLINHIRLPCYSI